MKSLCHLSTLAFLSSLSSLHAAYAADVDGAASIQQSNAEPAASASENDSRPNSGGLTSQVDELESTEATVVVPEISERSRNDQKIQTSAAPKESGSNASESADTDSEREREVAIKLKNRAGARAERGPDPFNEEGGYAQLPYIERYLPQENLWEVGTFLGAFIPARDHNIKARTLPQQPYTPALSLGFRAGYYPLSFFGVEAESMMAFSSTEISGTGANFIALRTQLVGQLPFYSVVPFLTIGGGFLSAASAPMGYDLDGAFHYGAGVKLPMKKLLGVRLDFRDNLAQKLYVQGESARQVVHHIELQLSVTITLGRKLASSGPDTDFDGLLDSEDVCPNVGAFTSDGCPFDRDNDGVVDIIDECPLIVGPHPLGCPESEQGEDVDADQDSINTPDDKCPEAPETRNGIEDDDGCPDEIPAELIRLLGPARGIMFELKGARIFDTSLVTLDELSFALKRYPRVRIEVTGHTSSEGEVSENQRLSLERATQVKSALVERGVESVRIVTNGVGSDEPAADNTTEEGRAENERVELRLLAIQ